MYKILLPAIGVLILLFPSAKVQSFLFASIRSPEIVAAILLSPLALAVGAELGDIALKTYD
jgi:hypothetical protein